MYKLNESVTLLRITWVNELSVVNHVQTIYTVGFNYIRKWFYLITFKVQENEADSISKYILSIYSTKVNQQQIAIACKVQ